MTRGRRGLVFVFIVLVIVAVAVWQLDVRTRAESIGPRFVEGLKVRHKDVDIHVIGPASLEVVLKSSSRIDVQLGALFDACRGHRFGCRGAIDRAIDDVDQADAMTRAPRREALRPMVVGDSVGFRYGYVAESFFGPLELRLVFARGLASAFVTSAALDRLGLSFAAAKAMAIAQADADGMAKLVNIDAAAVPALYRVRVENGDAVASLLDPGRIELIAKQLGTRKLDVFVPSRGILLVAAASDEAAKALDARRIRMPGFDAQPIGLAVFTFDLDAPEGQAMKLVPPSR